VTDIIDELMKIKPFSLGFDEKKIQFMKCISESIQFHYEHCLDYQNYCKKKNFNPDDIVDISDIPFLPINIFKKMTLLSVPKSEIIKIIKSSATTSNLPSIIHLDKKTVNRQIIVLNSIMRDFIGDEKMNFIIIDNKKTLETDHQNLSSRGSAIRGMLIFAKKFTCILNEYLKLDSKIISESGNLQNSKTCIFGFTWLIYKILLENKKNENFKNFFSKIPQSTLLHIGGWKKLSDLDIDKQQFNNKCSEFFNTSNDKIIDLYGMTEQLGIVYPDCEYGNKHVPIFSEILIRDTHSFEVQPDGKSGFIQVISPIPNSYPGVSLLTDDIGKILGRDNCPCGRKGTYFIFKKRSDVADPKGCGDTLDI
jgi:phenylacetate-coenzyme A ligase PaaK-like adenylate-forming protein